MKAIGIVVQVIASIVAGFASVFFIVIPALSQVWRWSYHGIALLISIVVAGLLLTLSGWLKDKAKERAKQKSDSK